jgi:hypothetical protein
MRRLLKICLGAVLAVLGGAIARRLFGSEEPGPAVEAEPAANPAEPTRDELYRQAQELQVEGRSKMNKQQLRDAVEAARVEAKA